MVGERKVEKSPSRMRRWLTRIVGANALAMSFLLPATHTLADSEVPSTIELGPPVEASAPLLPEYKEERVAPLQTGPLTRDTGIDLQSCANFLVCGTDLGNPFLLPNGSVGYLFGDTFAVAGPHIPDLKPGSDEWRSPVMLRSNELPIAGKAINFDSAANLPNTCGANTNGNQCMAPEFIYNAHRDGYEVSVLPNDAVSLPNGDIIASYMSIGGGMTDDNPTWQTNYSGLAISHDGNTFRRLPVEPGQPIWENTSANDDPFQMWSMQLDGDYVYAATVRAGRQPGPMMLLRVPWNQITKKGSYECWNGSGWGGECHPILPDTKYGEPSLRKLKDGAWVLSYVDFQGANLVTRTAPSPEGPWSDPKVQLTWQQLPALYGGFIHPYSTSSNLILMVSTWQTKGKSKKVEERTLIRYDVSHMITTTEK